MAGSRAFKPTLERRGHEQPCVNDLEDRQQSLVAFGSSLLARQLIELLPSSRRPEMFSRRIDNNESQFMMWLIYGTA